MIGNLVNFNAPRIAIHSSLVLVCEYGILCAYPILYECGVLFIGAMAYQSLLSDKRTVPHFSVYYNVCIGIGRRKFFIMRRLLLFVVLLFLSVNVGAKSVSVHYFLYNGEKCVYEDENVIVKFVLNQGVKLLISNKTDKVLYLDKTNSFSYLNGTATRMYSNASYSEGQTQERGGALNLGGIANALGANNTITGIMSGVTLSGNNGAQTIKTVQEERFLTIAPYGSYYIASWNYSHFFAADMHLIRKTYAKPVVVGREWHYSEINSPQRYSASLQYYTSQTLEEMRTISVLTYVENVVYDNFKVKKGLPYCEKYHNKMGYYFVEKNEGRRLLISIGVIVGGCLLTMGILSAAS